MKMFAKKSHLSQRGFTLLETLVALTILAIAMAAVMRATLAGTNHAEAMRMRILADWVAQNRLAEHAAACHWIPSGIQNGEDTQAGIRLMWKEEITDTPNPAFRRIEVSVSTPEDPDFALRRVTAFLVRECR